MSMTSFRSRAARALNWNLRRLLVLGAVSCCLLAGCEDAKRDPDESLSAAQLDVIQSLRARVEAGGMTEREFDEIRGQIVPMAEVEANFAALEAERAGLADLISIQGYTGQEDCFEPPDYMLLAEVVPATPIDPATRLTRRTSLRSEDLAARARVDAYLASPGTPSSLGVLQLRSDVDAWGRYHARYQQTHEGVPLTTGGLTAHGRDSGDFDILDQTLDLTAIGGLDTTPAIPDTRALEAAMLAVDPDGSRGYLATAALMIEPALENVFVGAGDPENGASYEWRVTDARLVYQVVVAPAYADPIADFDVIIGASQLTADDPPDPPSETAARRANTLLGGREAPEPSATPSWRYPTDTPYIVTVDAQSGEVLGTESLIETDIDDLAVPANTGTGYGWYNGRVELNTAYWGASGAYVLADTTRPKSPTANMVLHGKNLDSHDVLDFELMLDANDVWGNGEIDFEDPACLTCTKGQTPAVDIAFGMQRTYDLLQNVLGRWGTDDMGLNQVAVAHWDMAYTDAHFNSASGLIVFGNGTDATKAGNYLLSTVAHEVAHAIWHQEGVGKSGNPAKAMNEGHADVLGGLVDIYQDNTDGQGSWLYRIPWAGGKWRNRTLNPAGYEECETHNDIEMCETGSPYWDLFVEMSPFEHVGGIPFTRAIMHLAEGTSDDPASPYYSKFFPDTPMRGIGLNKAARIWLHMVNHFLPSSPKLAQARFAAWQAAEDLYGNDSTEAKATANAFAAVGMGLPAAGPAAPTISFAKVDSMNPRTLTARTYAVLDDDTGAEFTEPVGMARKNNAFLGYIDLSGMQVGNNTVTFRAVDSDGNATTTTRICRLHYRPQLLDDGGFEAVSGSAWSDRTQGDDDGGAMFGNYYLKARTTPTRQGVDLDLVKGPELSYWVAANKGVNPDDYLRVRVLDAGLSELAVLAEHGLGDDWFPRPARSNGYLNFRHDLGDWEGQEVVIEFSASRNDLFRVDHAVVSFSTVQLLPPTLAMFETDNSVFLTVSDADFAPFAAMGLEPRIYVNGTYGGPAVNLSGSQGISLPLAIDALEPGPNYAQTILVNQGGAFIAAGSAVWFTPKPVNELLANGRFEDEFDNWLPDGPVSLENANMSNVVFQGGFAARMGGAVNSEASITQAVSVPSGIKGIKLTLRARREYADANLDVQDQLIIDFLDASDAVIESAVLYDTFNTRLDHDPPHNFRTHNLLSYTPSVAKLAGKTVKVRLRTVNDDEGPSTFIIDNVSLSYSEWGLQIGG